VRGLCTDADVRIKFPLQVNITLTVHSLVRRQDRVDAGSLQVRPTARVPDEQRGGDRIALAIASAVIVLCDAFRLLPVDLQERIYTVLIALLT
jgi:hypothetical protein